jgi:hypothetical protein
MADKKAKFKSKLRDKFKRTAMKNKADGRSLSYKPLKGEHKEVSLPKSASPIFSLSKIAGKIKASTQKRAHELLGGEVKKGATKAHKGLTGIRHPAQLIPAIKTGSTLAGLIQSLMKK